MHIILKQKKNPTAWLVSYAKVKAREVNAWRAERNLSFVQRLYTFNDTRRVIVRSYRNATYIDVRGIEDSGIPPRAINLNSQNIWTFISSSSRGLNRFVASPTAVEGIFEVTGVEQSGVLTDVTLNGEDSDGVALPSNVTLVGPQATLAANRIDVVVTRQLPTVTYTQTSVLDATIEAISSPRNAASQNYWRGLWYQVRSIGGTKKRVPIGSTTGRAIAIRITDANRQSWMRTDLEWFMGVPVHMKERADGTRSIFLVNFEGEAMGSVDVSDTPAIFIGQHHQKAFFVAEVKDVSSTLLRAPAQFAMPENGFAVRNFETSVTLNAGGTHNIVVETGNDPDSTITVAVPTVLTDPMFFGDGNETSNDGIVSLEASVLFEGTVAEDGLTASGTLYYLVEYNVTAFGPESEERGGFRLVDTSAVEFHDLRSLAAGATVPGDYLLETLVPETTALTTGTHRAAETIWDWSYGMLWSEGRRSITINNTETPNAVLTNEESHARGRLTFNGTVWSNVPVANDQEHEISMQTEFLGPTNNVVLDHDAVITVTLPDGRTSTKIIVDADSRFNNVITDLQETVIAPVNGVPTTAVLTDIPLADWSNLFGLGFNAGLQVAESQEGRFYLIGIGRTTGSTSQAKLATVIGGTYEEVTLPGEGSVKPLETPMMHRYPEAVGFFFLNRSSQDFPAKVSGNVGLIQTYPTNCFAVTDLFPSWVSYDADDIFRSHFKLEWPSIMGQRGTTFLARAGNPPSIQKTVGGLPTGLVRQTNVWGLQKPIIWQMNNMVAAAGSGSNRSQIFSMLWKDIIPGRDGVCIVNISLLDISTSSSAGNAWRELEARFAAGDISVTQADVDTAYTEFTDTYVILYNNFASLDLIEAIIGTFFGTETVMILNEAPEEEEI